MTRKICNILCSLTLILSACSSQKWNETKFWYNNGKTINESLVDVFYIVSTEILEEKNSLGEDTYIGKLTPEERKNISAEMEYAHSMFGDSVNFFSPYYNQYTMSALNLEERKFRKIRSRASKDAAGAFKYYMHNLNNGRPFILAGFSQGSMHLLDILRSMDKKTYKNMIAAYSMGYRISAEDLRHPFVKAAQSADDIGTVISFNSVAKTDAIWPIVNRDAATCINPVNYHTDEEPAGFIFDGDTLSVHVDTTNNVLIVEGKNIASYRFPVLESMCKPGNLHHWDLLFYKETIRTNVMRRAYRKQD